MSLHLSHQRRRIGVSAERGLYLVATLCGLICASVYVIGYRAQQVADQFELRSAQRKVTSPVYGSGISRAVSFSDAEVIGRLEIPRLSLSVPILSDYDPNSLRRGVGHIHGTAYPGGLGNLVLAGHRDTFFRPLRRIAPGMEIKIIGTEGAYKYVVDSTEIVSPEAVQVLDIRERPELTLITCYPFEFIGAAPQRFIVHAHLESAYPDPM